MTFILYLLIKMEIFFEKEKEQNTIAYYDHVTSYFILLLLLLLFAFQPLSLSTYPLSINRSSEM